jgi:hypothetical protein
MKTGFLLRFQEGAKPITGDEGTTKTKTAVKKERPDEGLVIPLAGTKTLTEVKREPADQDPKSRSLYGLPR